MPALAWQLLWWLIANMDEYGEIHEAWKAPAAKQMRKPVNAVRHAADALAKHGFIEVAPRKRYCRVIIKNIAG